VVAVVAVVVVAAVALQTPLVVLAQAAAVEVLAISLNSKWPRGLRSTVLATACRRHPAYEFIS
jgi:hypothetical protein